jgi:hypothetical protein
MYKNGSDFLGDKGHLGIGHKIILLMSSEPNQKNDGTRGAFLYFMFFAGLSALLLLYLLFKSVL